MIENASLDLPPDPAKTIPRKLQSRTSEIVVAEQFNLVETLPFIFVHLFAFAWLYTGVKTIDVVVCVLLFFTRMFCITGGFHRYFAHRTYKLKRFPQFLLALGGTLAAQKGPLWWAGLHRHHHRFSDQPEDIHSPKRGFWWSHVGWILCDKYNEPPLHEIEDFAKYPELLWLDKFWLLPPAVLGVITYFTLGFSGLYFGFLFSTVVLYHATFAINSLAHVYGSRRYATRDTSRNNFWLALITLGEGWHNNHHHYQACARQGFFWWEIDISYYIIRAFSVVGIVADIKHPPESLLLQNHIADGYFDVGMFEAHLARANATLNEVRLQVTRYCDQRLSDLELNLEGTLSKAESTWVELTESTDGETLSDDYQNYVKSVLVNTHELLDSMSVQTTEFCEMKARALERSLNHMRIHAAEFFASRESAFEEILASIRSSALNFSSRANENVEQLTQSLFDIQQKAVLLS